MPINVFYRKKTRGFKIQSIFCGFDAKSLQILYICTLILPDIHFCKKVYKFFIPFILLTVYLT